VSRWAVRPLGAGSRRGHTAGVAAPATHIAGWASTIAVALLLIGACASGDGPRSAPVGIPRAPAACAGRGRDGMGEIRTQQWDAARAALEADRTADVWVGFSRVLSVAQVAKLPGSLIARGVLLVYEQRQGTYAKVQQYLPDVSVSDPSFGRQASDVLGRSAAVPNQLPGGAPDVFQPAEPDVAAGRPPIAGLKVTGDVAKLLHDDPCLIHSMSPGRSQQPAAIPPAIEPDVPLVPHGE
jgi:hypothetical protein